MVNAIACASVLALQQHEANYSSLKTEGLWPGSGMEGAINNQAADRKLYSYAHHNNEVIAACCERMIAV